MWLKWLETPAGKLHMNVIFIDESTVRFLVVGWFAALCARNVNCPVV
jgi:hypothetical protein